MKRKKRRLYLVMASVLALGGAVALVLSALEENLVFFYSPSDIQAEKAPRDRSIRIGGLVEQGTLAKGTDGATVTFTVTDTVHSVPATYRGILPDLFREGQGVVAEGRLRADGVFEATSVLAKHDEKYMPPEVADSLKRAGVWQHAGEKNAGEKSSGEKDAGLK
ncbi:MAG: cytochrome c maturation protein CcmE [Alphaproteobacteria bacterium]